MSRKKASEPNERGDLPREKVIQERAIFITAIGFREEGH